MNTLSTNLLDFTRREDFRRWLSEYHTTACECQLHVSKAYPAPAGVISYLDAVEESLCFGLIDSVHKIWQGTDIQRFSPRRRNSVWSELNKERCRRLERLGLMQPTGRAVILFQKVCLIPGYKKGSAIADQPGKNCTYRRQNKNMNDSSK